VVRKEKYNVFPQHAVPFALCLGPLFAGATAAEASWNPAFTRPGSGDPPVCRIGSARLHPDGSVEYEVYSKDGFPAHWGSVEKEEARVGDYIAKSWAFFATGDETEARSLTPDFFPKQIYPTRKGRNTLTIVIYALAAIMPSVHRMTMAVCSRFQGSRFPGNISTTFFSATCSMTFWPTRSCST
jgi:hypothetical protein